MTATVYTNIAGLQYQRIYPLTQTELNTALLTYATVFTNASNLTSGTVAVARLPTLNYMFKAALGTNLTISVSTSAKLILSNVVNNGGSYFDGTLNYRWTPPAGPIIIYSQALATSFDSATPFTLRILKNGEVINTNIVSANIAVQAFGLQTAQVSYVDQAGGTDWYEVFVTNNSSASVVVVNNAVVNTNFAGIAYIG